MTTVIGTSPSTVPVESSLERAVRLFIARRDRDAHPDGTFDSKRRWYPSESEQQPCCAAIRSPSASYPYSLMKHCRTVEHIALLCSVDAKVLRRAVRAQEPAERPDRLGGDDFYKAVAVTADGRYVSIFDGETEYAIGKKLTQAVRREHGGGFYVYHSVQTAARAAVPKESQAKTLPRAILRLRAEGQYVRYPCRCSVCREAEGDPYSLAPVHPEKLAFSSVTPLEVVQAANT